MKTYTIALNQALYNYNKTTTAMDAVTLKLSTGRKINSSSDDPSKWAKASKNDYSYKKLNAINDSLNSVAINVRAADSAMEAIGKVIDQMKATLEVIVKNYPPFPAGSEERAKLLSSFNSLRKQIDQLTIPPKNKGAMKILADPAVNKDAGDWGVILGEDGQTLTLHNQQVHTGETGLNIPEIPENATDEMINQAIANLERAQYDLNDKRSDLNMEAVNINNAQENNTTMGQLYLKYTETLINANDTETTAELKSLELKNSLTVEAINSLTNAQSQILSLWK
jgi:flagellin-like hook-associated protein FlgL